MTAEPAPVPIRVTDEDIPAIELPANATQLEKLIFYTLFGYWKKGTGKRNLGIIERTAKIEIMLKIGLGGIFFVALVLAAEAIGIPTKDIWPFVIKHFGG